MPYNQNQLFFIQQERADLRFLPSNIDILVMEFLKYYDVNVKPTDVGVWNGWDALATLDVFLDKSRGSDSFGSSILFASRSQQISMASKQAAEDWTTWKKWALDHKDFEEFKVKRAEEIENYNKSLLEKINSDELKEELDNIVNLAEAKQGFYKFYDWIKFPLYGFTIAIAWNSWMNALDCSRCPSLLGYAWSLLGPLVYGVILLKFVIPFCLIALIAELRKRK